MKPQTLNIPIIQDCMRITYGDQSTESPCSITIQENPFTEDEEGDTIEEEGVTLISIADWVENQSLEVRVDRRYTGITVEINDHNRKQDNQMVILIDKEAFKAFASILDQLLNKQD